MPSLHRHLFGLTALVARLSLVADAEFGNPGFGNKYYQASGYSGPRMLEHNQTGHFTKYLQVLWPQHAVIDSSGRIWIADKLQHQILLMKSSSRYISWPAFMTEYAGYRGTPGYVDGSRFKARFNGPSGIVLTTDPDTAFRLYVADSNNHCVRLLSYYNGRVATVAGAQGQPGFRDGPGQESRFNLPSSLGMDSGGQNLFVLDNGQRLRHVSLFLKNRLVTTLVGGACRAVERWTVYDSVVLRRVGCHPDWNAREVNEKNIEMFEMGVGVFYCQGHQATCAPRHHPSLADRMSPILLTQEVAEIALSEKPPEDPYADLTVPPPPSR